MGQKNKQLMVFLAGELQNHERIDALIQQGDFDYFAADAGYLTALKFNVPLKEVFGDFDSMPAPELDNLRVFPKEKDQTDSELALDIALEQGYGEIWMIAPFGGRLDHTFANLCLLEKAVNSGVTLFLYDGENLATMIKEGTVKLHSGERYYSFFPWGGSAVVSLRGFKYPLERYELKCSQPLAISNEAVGELQEIQVHQGKILYICVQ